MSEMARAARAAMKGKIKRLTSGEPKAKVDASSWTPPEMMNTEAKTGMRPISRRAFRKGGKVIEKCEGGEAMKRADRKQRKAGGRSLVTDLINRNDKKANLARDGGGAHVGGYKRGGDVEQDKKLIKKALAQHDKHMHGGKHEEIKLKKGGRTRKQVGGSMTEREKNAYNRRINDMLEDSRDVRTERLLMQRPYKTPYFRDNKDYASDAAIRELGRGDYDAMLGVNPKETGYKKGGKAGEKWIAGAIKHPGALHKSLKVPAGEKIPAKKLAKAAHSDNPKLAKRARLAQTLKRLHKGKGGSSDNYEMPPPAQESDFDKRTRELMPAPKPDSMPPDADMKNPVTGAPRTGRKKGGGTYFGGTRPTGGRMPRKAGGRTKGKTNISIIVNAQKPDQQQAMMPKMPTPSPLPVPPIAPPPMPMGAGAPPMPLPPGPPPAGLAGGAPGAMPPLPRKAGGRAYRSYKDMDAGALSGMGRLEKTEIEHGKRVGRLSGGRARSYKDMDAGALSGVGRIEKTAIQKHKR